ncbi:methionine--tRNA ligase [Clostridia bacterium]|nr:methionine--tRNA ligase [Clostridia bacterium]
MSKPYYLTTAIAYVQKKPHIGNVYDPVFADALARYRKSKSEEVYFLTGTDEHGLKLQQEAEKLGVTPQELVDLNAAEVRKQWDAMNVDYDRFIRTTDPKHERVVQKIFKKLTEQGDIYKGAYEGWYCTPCETFYTETQSGDEHKCPDCGAPLERANEEAYFFKLSKYADRLMAHIDAHPGFIQPESRRNEMIENFLKPGLQDLCVSRTSFSWGIPVDFDPKHVVYVWLDALTNYITAIGYDPDGSSELFDRLWPADVHIIGKDIVRFHTVYWPIFLMALGLELPKHVVGHPWMLFGADKMSKSKGNVIYADELAAIVGTDSVRYYLLREMPFAQDASITYEKFVARVNSDLANDLGNLLSRTTAMIAQYFGGTLSATDNEIEVERGKIDGLYESFRVSDALAELWKVISRANKYIDENTPWLLAKDESKRGRLEAVLSTLRQTLLAVADLAEPAIPASAAVIREQLVYPITKHAPLFPRLDLEEVLSRNA